MYRIGEQDNLIHYIHENAIEIIAENDLKSPSTETNQDCDLLQKLSGEVLTLCFNPFLQLCNFTSASSLLLIPGEHMLQHVAAQLICPKWHIYDSLRPFSSSCQYISHGHQFFLLSSYTF